MARLGRAPIALLFFTALYSQSAPSPPGSVSGVVINAKTGRPVSRAQVLLRESDTERPFGLLTDAQGRFSFQGIPPGTWTLLWSHEGFYAHTLNKRQEYRPRVPFTLEPGAAIAGIVIEVIPWGRISGTVFFPDGSPAEGLFVRVEPVNPGSTGRVAVTDETGAFRTEGLTAGRYLVEAQPKPAFAEPVRRQSSGELSDRSLPKLDLAPTFYPSVFRAAEAQPVMVESGQVTSDITITLQESPVFAIRGRLLSSLTGRAAPRSTSIRISPKGARLSRATVQTQDDGSFEVELQPGEYVFEAEATDRGRSVYLNEIVRLESAALNDVRLSLHPSITIKGRLHTEQLGSRMPAGRTSLTLATQDESSSQSATVKADGTFEINGLRVGVYSLYSRMPQGSAAYIKTVAISGIPQPSHEIKIGPTNDPVEMNLTVGLDGGRLEAEIIGPGADEPEILEMALFSIAAGDRYERSGWVRNPSPEVFEFTGIPPGQYRVLAWRSDQEPCDIYRPGTCRERGKLIEIKPGSEQRIQIGIEGQ